MERRLTQSLVTVAIVTVFAGHLPTTAHGQNNVFRDAHYSTSFGASKPRTFGSWSDLMKNFARPALPPRDEFETKAQYEQRIKQLNWRKEFIIHLTPTLLPYSHDHGGFLVQLSLASMGTSRGGWNSVEKWGPEWQIWHSISGHAGDVIKSTLCEDPVDIEVYAPINGRVAGSYYKLKWNCTRVTLLLRTGTVEKAKQLRANAASVELRLHCVYRGMSEKSVGVGGRLQKKNLLLNGSVKFREHTVDVTRAVAQLGSEQFALILLTVLPSFGFFYQRDTDLMWVKRDIVNGQPKVESGGKVTSALELRFPPASKALPVDQKQQVARNY